MEKANGRPAQIGASARSLTNGFTTSAAGLITTTPMSPSPPFTKFYAKFLSGIDVFVNVTISLIGLFNDSHMNISKMYFES